MADEELLRLLSDMEALVIASFKEKANEQTKNILSEKLGELKKILINNFVVDESKLQD